MECLDLEQVAACGRVTGNPEVIMWFAKLQPRPKTVRFLVE